ncbi:DnaJ domain-containing protein [Singulisphaera acidiphila]|uniref:DnaJ-class molecular chaperone with C-terminal Zn finger domain n=1 Tax=Singulisphaera acidiphila (strain ATCC BAA-1392 / DSM 18658 / VKM B-2454 / MOB10) TaxID=886293 RepID=L0D580_SINAD|nr:DnaJ domain-containing protein [Singulisphaera acidiphila]AGA24594.1 DnaJ-class molecular chaperone with C-terminal Zn finger domain [Singulisphaera acidiphila DSM 18658]
MNDPYEILGLERDADEAEIRQRYLALVREFSPDRAPERFAAIRAAYDEVRDPLQRLETQLFRLKSHDSIEAILTDLRARLRDARIPMETLLKLAETS